MAMVVIRSRRAAAGRIPITARTRISTGNLRAGVTTVAAVAAILEVAVDTQGAAGADVPGVRPQI
jgi:hypothetical protein